MDVLIIGGTGLISTGIIKHLQARGANITMFNRSKRENTLRGEIKQIVGDRNDFPAFEAQFKNARYDVVIDMIAFDTPAIESVVKTFGGRIQHYIFCSTVCTYGFKVPAGVLVDENFPQEPTFGYGSNKLACERAVLEAHAAGKFAGTVIRPSCTYGPGNSLIDNLESDPVAWDRIEKGLPILCSGDGLGLWVSTHRDDCGKLFAYASLNPKTYGQCYNATRDLNWTWRDQLAATAAALGKKARVVFMPVEWICQHAPDRFGLLKYITQFHGAYSSEKAKRDVPEFRCTIDFVDGAAETLADVRRRNAWRSSDGDKVYEEMLAKAASIGVQPIEL